MTSQESHPPPRVLLPNAKASAVAQSTQLSATANSSPVASRTSSQARTSRPRQEPTKVDYASEKNTLALIRRVLAPDTTHGADPRAPPRPVEELLPPLTSSNEVDIQLYAIVAIVVKDFVNSWYSKITIDHNFVEEVIQIIAHCSRALEQRLRGVSVEELVLDEIPALVLEHVYAYRSAYGPSAESAYRLKPHQTYHALNPHPALSPISTSGAEDTSATQQQNEAIYRQLLVQATLAVLLPTEDLENTCLRTLVGDIIADLILGQAVAGKVSEGWFLHETVTKVVAIVKAHVEPKATGEELQTDARSRLEKFGLLSSRGDDEKNHSSKPHQSPLSAFFWRIMQYGYLTFLFLRYFIVGMSQARYLPPRSIAAKTGPGSPIASKPSSNLTPQADRHLTTEPVPRPVLTYRIFDAISTLLHLSTRMPWLASFLAFWQTLLTAGAGRFGRTNAAFDKFLFNAIHTRILPASLLSPLLLNFRTTLFPSNSIGPPAPPPPSPEECLAVRRRAAEAILSLVHPIVARTFFATSDEEEWIKQVEEILDVFRDGRLNRYWIYGVLELVLVRLVPELAEKGWSELIAERGVNLNVPMSEQRRDAEKGDKLEDESISVEAVTVKPVKKNEKKSIEVRDTLMEEDRKSSLKEFRSSMVK